jgi:hypothetical protein
LVVELAGDQVLVSTIIRDRSGAVVAEIVRNEWKVNSGNVWDRNYSRNALEVRGPTGDVVLQVRLVKDRVQLQAKIYTSEGLGMALVKVPGRGGAIEYGRPNQPLESIISPIFKYPSDLHLGELVDPQQKSDR